MKMAETSTKRVNNTVGKGGIARYEQFLLFPQCLLKACTADMEITGLVLKKIQVEFYLNRRQIMPLSSPNAHFVTFYVDSFCKTS